MNDTRIDLPRFAVVGHPNKGKSSIVATLAQDDSVYIDRIAGTTTTAQHYPMRVDGNILYELIDTPGFQRARATLAWLNKHCNDVSQRPLVVKQFCEQHRNQEQFRNECELLQPIVDGAGIIYVVDGSRPYGQEYNAEMEILRWTGRPSLALINPIDNDNYVADWETALGQYFKTVRIFNAHRAEFVKRIGLLTVFGQLQQNWQQPLERAVTRLKEERQHQHQQAAEEITALLIECLQHQEKQYLPTAIVQSSSSENNVAESTVKSLLAKKYQTAIKHTELKCRRRVEEIYNYLQLELQERDLASVDRDSFDQDLFDQDTWYLFGLSKKQLITAAAGAGASAGVLVDIGLGGHSLLLGSVVGGLIGGASAWRFSDKIANFTVKGLPTGGKTLSYGPAVHPNFPFVVLGRALRHHQLLCTRTHAVREALAIDENSPLTDLSGEDKSQLMKIFNDVRKGKKVLQHQPQLTTLILKQLTQSDGQKT